jgi:AbrB family looped-hinge helix DNA binding protein
MRRRYRSKITRKGQITIAAEARRDVGLKIGDAVDLIVDGGKIVGIEPAENWAERTYGILRERGTATYDSDDSDAWADAAIERDDRSTQANQSDN